MLDVPPHLYQPLYIDTNINYELDMSKFPGLDDPQQMYQPALLIATDWSDYVYDDMYVQDDAEYPTSLDIEDDLFSLIESCQTLFPDVDIASSLDLNAIDNILDDVITDSSYEDFDISDVITDNAELAQLKEALDTLVDINVTDTAPELYVTDVGCDKNNVVDCNITKEGRVKDSAKQGLKRRRSVDREYQDKTKKSKMADMTSPRLPIVVSVCPSSKNSAMYREC